MKIHYFAIAVALSFLALLSGCKKTEVKEEPSLKSALEGKFLMGVAVNDLQASGMDTAGVRLINEQFNSVVAENCMKSEVIHPEEDRYDFTKADRFVALGEKQHAFIVGHTLIWHSQLAPWFCVDKTGKNVSREVLIKRMRDHIYTVFGRYKGRIKGWDVVNEAFEDDGSYRKTKFYDILGKDYIPLAFQFAHEADPDAELYYNDFSMAHKAKREAVVRLVGELKAKGLRIDGVGMQTHLQMDFPPVKDYEESLLAFANAGVKVMITEMDLTILPTPDRNIGANVGRNFAYSKEMNPYPDALPDSVAAAWTARMEAFFNLFLKHSDKISRVTMWGVADSDSWRNDWPVRGRTDYPLLFDRQHHPKPIVAAIIKAASENK